MISDTHQNFFQQEAWFKWIIFLIQKIEKSKSFNYKIKKFQQVHIRKIEWGTSTDIYEDHITRDFDDLSKIDLIFHLHRERIEYMSDTLILDIIEIITINWSLKDL